MANNNSTVQTVDIRTKEIDKLAQIERAMISAGVAIRKLREIQQQGAEIKSPNPANKTVVATIMAVKNWARENLDALIEQEG